MRYLINFFIVFSSYSANCNTEPVKSDNNLSEMKKIFSDISNNKFKMDSSNSAVFYKEKTPWTILGAVQKNTYHYKKSIQNPNLKPFNINILNTPISSEKILPFTYPIKNSNTTNTINIITAGNEYEPFSFVITAGNSDISSIKIKISDFTFDKNIISSEKIDIKIVKPWYQSGESIHRGINGQKRLVPELLLRNDNLIKVNNKHQVNLIRNYNNFVDSKELKPFNIPKRTNKQIWGTFHTDTNTPPGIYTGNILIEYTINNNILTTNLTMSTTVLPFNLKEPAVEYALYYLARLNKQNKPVISSRSKSISQIKHELLDMKKHGLTNVALDYGRDKNIDGTANMLPFYQVANIAKNTFNQTDFLFVDWHMENYNDKNLYKSKLQLIKDTIEPLGYSNIYIYNFDEAPINKILSNKHTLVDAHELGLKNFSATKPQYIPLLNNYFDIFVLHRDSMLSKKAAKYSGSEIWAYNDPQAGEEKPALYRTAYGISLWLDYFSGSCNYAYQTGQPGWNDWADPKWRPHNMTYPTLSTPISTLQWEGWREGIDDSRYLQVLISLYKPNQSLDREEWLESIIGIPSNSNPKKLRSAIIKAINKFRKNIL